MLPSLRIPLPRTFLASAALGLASASASAATLYWDGGTSNIGTAGDGLSAGGNGTWNTTLRNWDAGTGAHVAWNNAGSDTAVFAGTAGTVTLGTGITAGGLTFNTKGYTVTGNMLTMGASGLTIDTAAQTTSGSTTTIASVIAGIGSLTLASNGNMTASGGSDGGLGINLTGTNTFTGTVTITSGLVSYTSDAAFGNAANTIVLNGGGLLDPNRSLTLSRNIQVASGGGTIRLYGSSTSTFTGAISGTGSLARTDGGKLILTGTNSFSGTWLLQNGTTVFNSLGSENGAANLNLTGGTLRLGDVFSGQTATIGNLSGTGGTISTEGTVAGVRTLSINQTSDAGFGGSITDGSAGVKLALVKDGVGTLTLTGGGASYTGATVVNAGKLVVNGTLRGTSGITVNAGATLETGGTNIFVVGHGTALSDTFAINVNGGTWTITGGESRIGNVNLSNGATWTSNRGVGSWDWLLANTASGAAATVTVSGTGKSVMNGTGGIHLQGVQNFNVADTVAGVDADLEVSMILANAGSVGGAAGGINKTGSGTMVLTGTNTYSGSTTIADGKLIVGGAGLLGSGNYGGAITLATASVAFEYASTASQTLSGVIDGSGSVVKSGSGTFILSGTNTYSGGTTVTGGILQASLGTTVGARTPFGTGAVAVNGGSQVKLMVGSTSGTLTFANDFALSAADGETTTLYREDGNVVLTGNVSVSTAGTGKVVISSRFGQMDAKGLTLAGVLSGSGNLTVSRVNGENGAVHLSNAANTYSGTITVDATSGEAGLLVLDSAGAAASAKVNLAAGGARLNVNTANATIAELSGVSGSNVSARTAGNVLTVNQSTATTFAGTLGGTGISGENSGLSLVKDGAGTLTLTGTNKYTGTTEVKDGLLLIGDGNAIGSIAEASTVTVSGSGRLGINRSDNTTFANNITGTGGFVKRGRGTLILDGANTYSGVTQVEEGTLKLNDALARQSRTGAIDISSGATFDINGQSVATDSLTGAGTLALGAGTFTKTGLNTLFSGNITGTGAIILANESILTLSGDITSTGAVTVNPGAMLVLGNGGATGSLASTSVTNNGFIVFNRSGSVTVDSVFSGTGAVLTNGPGSLSLSGGINNQAVTNVGPGTLVVTAAQNLTWVGHYTAAYFAPSVVGPTTHSDITASGTVGGLYVEAGTLTLRANTLTGTAMVIGGVATVSAEVSAGVGIQGGSLVIGTGATDTKAALTSTSVNIGSGGVLALSGANLTADHLAGAGTVEVQAGTARLGAANSGFAGTVTLTGGDLRLASASELGGASLLDFNSGTLTYTGSVQLDLSQDLTARAGTYSHFNSDQTVVLVGKLSGSGVIENLGTGTFDTSGADLTDWIAQGGRLIDRNSPFDLGGVSYGFSTLLDYTPGTGKTYYNTGADATMTVNLTSDSTYSGVIQDNIRLVKSGAATLTLAGASTYTLGTQIDGGTLRVVDGGSLGSGPIVVNERGILQIDRSTAFTIADYSGAGTLAQTGTGLLTFTQTTLDIGRLTGSGDIAFSGSAVTVASGAYSGKLSGNVTFTKTGVGTLVLTGDQTGLTGAITVAAGILQLGDGVMNGTLGAAPVTIDGALVFNEASAVSIGSVFTGAGGLTQSGPGKVTLTGTSSNTGATIVQSGVLAVGGASGKLGGGALDLRSGGTLVYERSGVTLSNAITGDGALRVDAAGTMTLSGANTMTGGSIGTVAGAGTRKLVVQRGSADIIYANGFVAAAGTTVELTGTGRATLAGALSGAGTLRLLGAGGATAGFEDTASKAYVLTARDNSAFTGVLDITTGNTLDLGASGTSVAPTLGGSLLVRTGAALRGTGTIAGNITVANGGVIAPGHSPGIITVGGDFSTGGVAAMQIDGAAGAGVAGGYDQIRFGGVATLGGSLNLAVNGLAAGQVVQLFVDTAPVSGSGSFLGSFDSISITGATPGVGRFFIAGGGAYFLNANSLAEQPGLTLHEGVRPFADALTGSGGVAHPDAGLFIAGIGAAAPAQALQNASPVGLAALSALPIEQARRESDDLRRRAESRALADEVLYGDTADWQAYVSASGATLEHDDALDTPTFNLRTQGGAVGLESRIGSGDFTVGVRLGYDRGSATLHANGGRFDQDRADATLYGLTRLGERGYLSASIGAGHSFYDVKRYTVSGTQRASVSGLDLHAALDAGFVMPLGDSWLITPHAGLGFSSSRVAAFTERGSSLALAVDGHALNSVYARVGTGLYREWASSNMSRSFFRFGLDVAYERELANDSVRIDAAFDGQPNLGGFTTEAAALSADRLVVGPQAEWMISEARSVSVGYRFQYGFDGSSGHRVDIGFAQRF